ncbi:MAG: class I SAM-dependent methyltransferase, partial [Proteobacteria bacterium]|nr:class I SAM-dependent methyltransferase [Pseudomonadota bacterium]
MQLNRWELLAMNNPVRKFLMREVEFRGFCNLINIHEFSPQNLKVLDVACGSAYSSYLINKSFSPNLLVSFDLMHEQIKIAQKLKQADNLYIGDVESISIKSDTFDCIFGFGL